MMQPGDMTAHREEFARVARKRLEERHTQERDRDRRKEREASAREDDFGIDAIAAMASVERIEAFSAKLDHYDTAIMEMMLENERMLAEVRRQREAMLRDATTLPDGRRVFRSEDGSRVVDEFGADVSDEISADAINKTRPSLEMFEALDARDDALVAHNADLNALQMHLDEGRALAGREGVSTADLVAFEADMDQALAALQASQPTLDDQPAPARDAAFDLEGLEPLKIGAPQGP